MKMHKKDTPLLIRNLGECKDSKGNDYALLSSMSGEMVVKSGKTGKIFEITWTDFIDLAISQGLNKEDDENVE